MEEKTFAAGDKVTASYKSGTYIGEIVEVYPPRVAIVKILAVVKHPAQGDLHHPFEAGVPIFHQRRALSYQEKASAPLAGVKLYEGEVPEYRASLLQAVEAEIEKVESMPGEWASRSLKELEALKEEYAQA
jgi:kinase-associated protein B